MTILPEPRTADASELWRRHMRQGDFGAAWQISDLVLRSHAAVPCWHLPRHLQYVSDGTPLEGRRVLVRCYHGLGDTIQFIRYMPILRSIAADVIVWVQPELIPLFRSVPWMPPLMPLHDGDPGVIYDVDVEIMELAHVFRSTLETLPAKVSYLQVDPASLPRDSLAVGIVWRAGEWDDRRSIPFRSLARLGRVPGVTFHVLQRGPGLLERLEGFGRLSGSDDALSAARVIKALDLVISVDSMVAHLAGALGVPVWNLLHAAADWRWMERTQESPWYPTMRLFRQGRSGGWEPVIARVAAELGKLADAS